MSLQVHKYDDCGSQWYGLGFMGLPKVRLGREGASLFGASGLLQGSRVEKRVYLFGGSWVYSCKCGVEVG